MTELSSALQQFLSQQTGASIIIEAVKPIAGGASRETHVIVGSQDGAPFQMVLRRDLASEMIDNALTRSQEFALLQAAYAAGVKVPKPRYVSADPNILERPFLLMDYVEGISIGPKVVRAPELEAARAVLPAQLGEQIARVHQMNPDDPSLSFLERPSPNRNPAQHALDNLRAMIDRLGVQNPAVAFAVRWCEQNAPDPLPLTIIHGDFRIGNVLVGPEGLRAIIDWEFSHIGDPREDLAWPCVRDWRFGKVDRHFGGIDDREAFLSAYEQHRNVTIDRKAVDYWEILGNLRWGVTCLAQAERHLSGKDISIEFASLGRRAVEMQAEYLRLIQAWKD